MSIEAMKQALEALEYHQEQTRPIHKTQETIIAVRKAIKQAEKQKPVAYYWRDTKACYWIADIPLEDLANLDVSPLYAAPPKRPVKSYTGGEPQYATDAPKHEDDDIQEYKRPWVGLTDEEIDAIGYKYGAGGLELMDELTSKLKEKNGG
jgi:hypothetical protein